MRSKFKAKDIEQIACDGRVILALSDLIFADKKTAIARVHIPATADIKTACEAMEAAKQRVKYAYNIDLILSPCPAEISTAADNYKEVCEVIIRAINRDFNIDNFAAAEADSGVFFSFDLHIPQDFEKNNAELLYELKKQFKKLGNNVNISVTIIREYRQKSH